MIIKSAFVQYAPRPGSTTATEPRICRIVFDDETATQWFLTKAKGIQIIDTALEIGAITSEEELILKQQVYDNDALYACHPNIDEAAALIQEADGDEDEVLFAIFMERDDDSVETPDESASSLALPA